MGLKVAVAPWIGAVVAWTGIPGALSPSSSSDGYRMRRSRIPIEEVLDYFVLVLMLISRAGSEDDWAGKCDGRFPESF